MGVGVGGGGGGGSGGNSICFVFMNTNKHVVMVAIDLVKEVLECDWVLNDKMLRCLWEDANL